MFVLVASQQEICQNGNDLRVQQQSAIGGVLQVFQEVAKLLKSLLAQGRLIDLLRANHGKEFVQKLLHVSDHVDGRARVKLIYPLNQYHWGVVLFAVLEH